MRTRPTRERAESRLVNRYHKLHEPLIELVQALEDVLPIVVQLDDTAEIATSKGELLVSSRGRTARIILHDKDCSYIFEV